MRKHFTTVLILFLSFTIIYGQFSTIESFGAKAVGNGNCISAFSDINSVYGNVAGISNINNFEADLSYENRFQAFNLSMLSFGIGKSFSKIGTFGLSIKKFGISEYNEFQAGINYARKLTDALSIGIRFNMYNLLIEEYGNRTGFNADAGIQYMLNDKLKLGFYLINPFPVKFVNEVKLPTLAFLGLHYKISDNLGVFAEIEKHLDREFLIKGGLEFNLMENLSFYGGFRNDLEQFADFSFGIRYSISPLVNLNICSQYNTVLGLSPALSVSYVKIK
jgi:hypothetical protein